MAIIGKIREKSVLLVIIIGLALLAFILGGYEKMSMGGGDNMGSGTIFGEKIDEEKFQKDIEKFTISDQQEFQKNQREYTAKDQDASEDKAWNFNVETSILEREFEALGIDVSPTEFDAYLYGTNGFTVMPDLAQGFRDSVTGEFSKTMLQQTIEKLKSSTKPEEQKSWAESKEYYTNKRKQEKYFAILKQGAYVTKLEAQNEYYAKREEKNISYVVRRYSEIEDDKIKVSDEDLKAYYEEHKSDKKYENKMASRDVKYFDVTIQPSKTDSSDFDKELKKLKTDFGKNKTTQEDSIFVMMNSEAKSFSSQKSFAFRPEGDPKARPGMTIPRMVDTLFRTASIGQIVGPYNDNGSMRIAKVLAFNTKSCKVRHILLSAPKGDEKKIKAAQAKADSIVKLLNKDNFEQFVMKYSEDPGSKDKGGVYEDFIEGEMVPTFSDFSAQKPIGTIGTVKTDFGIHIIEVLDRKEVRFPILAVVQKTLLPSEDTQANINDEAYKMLYKLDGKLRGVEDIKKKIELFDTIVSKAKYKTNLVQIQTNKPSVYGFNSEIAENKILKMAFDEEAEVGDLCASPIKDKNRYLIAIYSAKHEKGEPAFEEVEDRMKAEYIKEKKAEKLIAQMVGKSLDACAKKGNTKVEKTMVSFSLAQIQGSGLELEVVGFIFSGLKDGAKTLPLKGEQGVYVIRIDKTTKAPATVNFEEERKALLTSIQGSIQGSARMALMKTADVVDNRRFLRAGIRFEH